MITDIKRPQWFELSISFKSIDCFAGFIMQMNKDVLWLGK